MRIATISKSDLVGGGASKVAQILSDRFAETHPGSIHLCASAGTGFVGHRIPLCSPARLNDAVRLGHGIGRRLGFAESLPIETSFVVGRIAASGADVVHVHDTSTAISPITLSVLSRMKPLIWTMHDASPVTGGCIQPMDCTRFRTGCGRCPVAGEWPINGPLDLTRLHRWLRGRLHGSGRVTLVSPSEWMRDLATSSGMLAKPPIVIPNPVDTGVFRPARDKGALRRRLGLPTDRVVLIAAAGHVGDPRKGVADAIRTVSLLNDMSPHLVLVGKGDASLAKVLDGLSVTATGFVADVREMSDWYAASDALVYCSAIDNQPLTILESMACGVPTFGYAVGGSGELVSKGVTGFMVPHGNVDALACALREAITACALGRMGEEARRFILQSHTVPLVAAQHLDLYSQVIEEGKRRGI